MTPPPAGRGRTAIGRLIALGASVLLAACAGGSITPDMSDGSDGTSSGGTSSGGTSSGGTSSGGTSSGGTSSGGTSSGGTSSGGTSSGGTSSGGTSSGGTSSGGTSSGGTSSGGTSSGGTSSGGTSSGGTSSGGTSSGGSSGGVIRTSFSDYFLPTPVARQLTSSGWGASNVQPRDQDNGLEDRTMSSWSYWDGRIVKGADGRYHMFASRWPQAQGHWGGWPGSICVHAVSDTSPLGPYVDKGPCYADAGGKGHNVMGGQLADGSYYILVSETRQPAVVYGSSSLDGPWTSRGTIDVRGNGLSTNGTSSNTTFWPNPDGSILATSRWGIIMVSTGGPTGPFVVKTGSVYPNIPFLPGGPPEDPCLWYSGGQYHMVYSYPLDRKMYHLTSPDGLTWTNKGLAIDATKPFIRYTDGTVNVWNKLERPQVYLEDGHVKYFTFAAIDVDKGDDRGNDNHGSKIIVVPFDGVAFDADTGVQR